jgi:hypothetical protein
MVKKLRNTKGIHPRKNKTSRKEIPVAVRAQITALSAVNTPPTEIARVLRLGPSKGSTVTKVINRAKRRSQRDRKPLTDITCVENSPGNRHRPRLYNDEKESQIIKNVSQDRISRAKSTSVHIQEMNLDCSKSTFEKIMYKGHFHYLEGAEKPELTAKIEAKRREVAQDILNSDIKSCIFIDEANMRSEYGRQKAWHKPGEYFHPDVVQKTRKVDYQKAEFMGAIMYNHAPGPYHIFKKETLDELKAADEIIKRLQDEEEPRLRVEFEKREVEKEVNIPLSPLLM